MGKDPHSRFGLVGTAGRVGPLELSTCRSGSLGRSRLERRLHAGSPYRSNDLVSAGPEPPLSCDLRLNHAKQSQIARVLVVDRLLLRTNQGGIDPENKPNSRLAARGERRVASGQSQVNSGQWMRRDETGGDTDASLANGTESAMAFSGWHARVFASMECRGGHAGQGYPADRVTPGLSMLTLRVSMAPVPIAVESRSGVGASSR